MKDIDDNSDRIMFLASTFENMVLRYCLFSEEGVGCSLCLLQHFIECTCTVTDASSLFRNYYAYKKVRKLKSFSSYTY